MIHANRRGKTEVKIKRLTKWDFYLVIAEGLMVYTYAIVDDETISKNNTSINKMLIEHAMVPYLSFDKN